jgi:hypothetical protein
VTTRWERSQEIDRSGPLSSADSAPRCWRCWPWCWPPASPPPHRLERPLPITITNDTGRSALHRYVLGVDLTTGKLGYVNADGAFTPWSLPGGPVHVVGPISRTLCGALHRGTLGESSREPVTDAGRFYQRELTNHYSAIVHANMKEREGVRLRVRRRHRPRVPGAQRGPGAGVDHPRFAGVRPGPGRQV